MRNDISDHYGIFCVLRTTLELKTIKYIIKRHITRRTAEKFKELMSTVGWILITKL